MDTNTTARPNALTTWWSACSAIEKAAVSLAAALVGLVLGAGLGIGVAAAVGGDTAPAEAGGAPGDSNPEPAPDAPRPVPTVPPTTTAPAPAPTIPPTSTTVDPRPARRAEIADEVRVLNAAIDQRRSEINAHRIAEVEVCRAESERLEQEYVQRQAETSEARRVHDRVELDLTNHLIRNPPLGFGSDGRFADPQAQRLQAAHIAAVEALETAEAAEQAALDAGVAHGEMCAARRAGYGPIDEDSEIQELMVRRQALIAEYESLS